ncbi:MAG: hypothetical protein KGD63_07605 [Candidatus Lokiarchaeota archaeon]|nr:hypothetical protein [Candidatus Lokiarchaeota archaeon]
MTSELMIETLLMKHVLNSMANEQSNNLRAVLPSTGKVDNRNKFWNFIKITNFL